VYLSHALGEVESIPKFKMDFDYLGHSKDWSWLPGSVFGPEVDMLLEVLHSGEKDAYFMDSVEYKQESIQL
jgi:hypothetical protein